MNKYIVAVASMLLSLQLIAQTPYEYVNPFIGTGAHGHTYPGATVPHGLVQLSPDTRVGEWDACSGYNYKDKSIMGFSHTHLSGTGCGDLGDILIKPFDGRASFSHSNEEAHPGYYSVVLDNGMKCELTATTYCGMHRYRMAGTWEPEVLEREAAIAAQRAAELAARRDSLAALGIIEPDPDARLTDDDSDEEEIINPVVLEGASVIPPASGEYMRLIIDLGHLIDLNELIMESDIYEDAPNEIVGMRRTRGWADNQPVFFVIRFDRPISTVNVYSDYSQTPNREQSVNKRMVVNFYNDKQVTFKVALSLTSIEEAKRNLEHDIRGFNFDAVRKHAQYTWENELNRITFDGGTDDQRSIFYTAMYHTLIVPNIISDASAPHPSYSTFSIWDTFRAWNPLMALLYPDLTRNMINSYIEHYDEFGALPIWTLWGRETDTMIGYHAASIIWDAYQRGIRGFDADKALKAMIASTEKYGNGSFYYVRNGFIPSNMKSESVSSLLEFAYDDWCIAQMARALGKEDIFNTHIKRSQNYINIFDGRTRFFRGKRFDGNIDQDFNPYAVGRDYTEATAWQYRFFVPHDMSSLVQLFGGEHEFEEALDSLFQSETKVIGEMNDIEGMIGQYAHGNEPSHHMAFLYNYVGKQEKTDYYVHRILSEMYRNAPDGITGNEDCGQMSAWYMLAAMGIYPVCPGSGEWHRCKPLFQNIEVDGEPLSSLSLRYFEYNPDRVRPKVSLPYIDKDLYLFEQKQLVTIGSATPDADIYYTLDGKTPTQKSKLYKKPITVSGTQYITARAFKQGYEPSAIMSLKATRAKYHPGIKDGEVELEQGVEYTYAEGNFTKTDDLLEGILKVRAEESEERLDSGVMDYPDITNPEVKVREDHFGLVFDGYIYIPAQGVYEFQVTSDDGSVLLIDNQKVVDNDGSHSEVSATGRIALQAGMHPYRLLYIEDFEGQALKLEWREPGKKYFHPVPHENLFRKR